MSQQAFGWTYYVDPAALNATDTNPGTEYAPWKTIARAGKAPELRPGDTVFIKSGVYRECVDITVSGEPGRPIIFKAAPNARVVLKGSEMVRGTWTRLDQQKGVKEPFPHAFQRVWKHPLGEEFFTDSRFPGTYTQKTNRWVSQVFINDDHPFQLIGPDYVYRNDNLNRIVTIGHGLIDMISQSFCFDPIEQMLYLNIEGDPAWYTIEVGVRGFTLTVTKAHDVVVRGLEMRHNRQPGDQWPLVEVSEGQRVVIEDCKVSGADFIGLGLIGCKECMVRRCDLSHNGCSGLALGLTEDCTVEDCSLQFNNYRHFLGDWGVAAGMKNIPRNKRTTIRRCEAAYNLDASGIWFDSENSDIRILDNVCHDNDACGIFFEINPGGGVIAGNLVYGNHGRGIYVSGSQNTWVVHNIVAENASGIVAMSRAKDEPARNTQVFNNLLIHNYTAVDTPAYGSDLTLEMSRTAAERAQMASASDNNLYANNSGQPVLRPDWNDAITLSQWQERYGQDKHSVALQLNYEHTGTRFRLLTNQGLNMAAPLPSYVSRIWKSQKPARVGGDITSWP
jgi:parallel beta-helix repeat protein